MMDKNKSDRFLHRFVISFFLLFFIAILLPFLLDQAMHLFTEGIVPEGNSIIVFKDSNLEYEAIYKFLKTVKKIINFM